MRPVSAGAIGHVHFSVGTKLAAAGIGVGLVMGVIASERWLTSRPLVAQDSFSQIRAIVDGLLAVIMIIRWVLFVLLDGRPGGQTARQRACQPQEPEMPANLGDAAASLNTGAVSTIFPIALWPLRAAGAVG